MRVAVGEVDAYSSGIVKVDYVFHYAKGNGVADVATATIPDAVWEGAEYGLYVSVGACRLRMLLYEVYGVVKGQVLFIEA